MKTVVRAVALVCVFALVLTVCACAGPNGDLKDLMKKNPSTAAAGDAQAVLDAVSQKDFDSFGADASSFSISQAIKYLVFGELNNRADERALLTARDRIISELVATGEPAAVDPAEEEQPDEQTAPAVDDGAADEMNAEFNEFYSELACAESAEDFLYIASTCGLISDEEFALAIENEAFIQEYVYYVVSDELEFEFAALRDPEGVYLSEKFFSDESSSQSEPVSVRLPDINMGSITIPGSAGHSLMQKRSAVNEDGEAEFVKVSDAYKFIENTTGVSPDVAGALVWLSLYAGNGNASSSATTTRLLEAFKDSVTNDAVTGAKKETVEELYFSQLERYIESPLLTKEELSELYNSYIALDSEDCKQRALDMLQQDPSTRFADLLMETLDENNANAYIQPLTMLRYAVRDDGIAVYYLLLRMQEEFFVKGEDNGRTAEVLALINANSEYSKDYDIFCERYSSFKNFWEVNADMCDYLELEPSDFGCLDVYDIYLNNKMADELKDGLYREDAYRFDTLGITWTSDLISGYYGTTNYTAATPQDDLYLLVYDSEEYAGFDDEVTYALEDRGLTLTTVPSDAKVAAYVSEYYGYAGSYNTTGDSSYRPTYSAYVSIKLVNTVTGETIGSMSLVNTPQIGGSDFWEDEESIHMYFPNMSDSDYDTLHGYADAAAAIEIPSDTPAEA